MKVKKIITTDKKVDLELDSHFVVRATFYDPKVDYSDKFPYKDLVYLRFHNGPFGLVTISIDRQSGLPEMVEILNPVKLVKEDFQVEVKSDQLPEFNLSQDETNIFDQNCAYTIRINDVGLFVVLSDKQIGTIVSCDRKIAFLFDLENEISGIVIKGLPSKTLEKYKDRFKGLTVPP